MALRKGKEAEPLFPTSSAASRLEERFPDEHRDTSSLCRWQFDESVWTLMCKTSTDNHRRRHPTSTPHSEPSRRANTTLMLRLISGDNGGCLQMWLDGYIFDLEIISPCGTKSRNRIKRELKADSLGAVTMNQNNPNMTKRSCKGRAGGFKTP